MWNAENNIDDLSTNQTCRQVWDSLAVHRVRKLASAVLILSLIPRNCGREATRPFFAGKMDTIGIPAMPVFCLH